MNEEDYILDLLKENTKLSTLGPVQKNWLVLIYKRSEDYALDQNFY